MKQSIEKRYLVKLVHNRKRLTDPLDHLYYGTDLKVSLAPEPITLEMLQEFVDGYIETLALPWLPGIMIVFNEEGKLHDMPPTFPLLDSHGQLVDIVVGSVLFVAAKGDELVGLTSDQVASILGNMYGNERVNSLLFHAVNLEKGVSLRDIFKSNPG